LRSQTEFRRHQPDHDSAVEGVAGDSYAGSANHRITTGFPSAWAKLSKREVARATAEVPNQYELIVIELSFILISGSDRLQLERDLLKPRQLCCGLQALQRERFVLLVFSSCKTNRPSQDDLRCRGIKLLHHCRSQASQDDRDQIFQGIVTAVDAGRS